MKKIFFILALILATTINTKGENFYDGTSISLDTFYEELSPYGEWINTADYGYAWRPYSDNGEHFKPYATRGKWVYTDYGWTWVSDYRWGWAPFHYGRWYYDTYYGWMWVPGTEWAPAWVTWGSYNQCWAWAPMGPEVVVSAGFNRIAPVFWWNFVPRQHFCSGNWYSYAYHQPVQINNIICITNVYTHGYDKHHHGRWFHGPRVGEVERHLRHRAPRMDMAEVNRHRTSERAVNRTESSRRDNHRTWARENSENRRDNIRHDNNSRRDEKRREALHPGNFTRPERQGNTPTARPPLHVKPERSGNEQVNRRAMPPAHDSRVIRSSGESKTRVQASNQQKRTSDQQKRTSERSTERRASAKTPRNQ